MPSPFPGMDPYLEEPTIWTDVHLTLIVAMRAELNAHLPAGYLAAADRHVWIENSKENTRRLAGKPDSHVVETQPITRETPAGTTVAVASPRTVTHPLRNREGKPYLKIIDAQERRLITAIEMLSPSNKTPGADRSAYLAKREEYLTAGVNLVEINLLRGGKSLPLGKPRLPKGHYYILVCRAKEIPAGQLWPFTVKDPLAEVVIPLREGESMTLNLRACLDRSYDEARYDREIDYTQPPKPALEKEDGAWAEELLKRNIQA